MKSFYDLERKEYKEVSRKFRKTHIGKFLYSMFSVFSTLVVLDLFGVVIMNMTVLENADVISSTIEIGITTLIAVITYYVYFHNLKKYYDECSEK